MRVYEVYIEATIIASVRFFLLIIGNREFLVPSILVGNWWRLESSGSELISVHVSDPLIVPSVYEEQTMIGTSYGSDIQLVFPSIHPLF